jgi:two-component system, sensor histidine kinase
VPQESLSLSPATGGNGHGGRPARRREPIAPALPAVPTVVLVVEDLDDARDAIGELLLLGGFEVELAPDGLKALELASLRQPQVALVDIGLPGLDGYEVARRLRQRYGNAITLYAMTGYGQAEDRTRALSAGFDQHLVKPVDPARLLALLRQRQPVLEDGGSRGDVAQT